MRLRGGKNENMLHDDVQAATERAGLNAHSLARATGVPYLSVWRYLTGRAGLGGARLDRLLDCLTGLGVWPPPRRATAAAPTART